MEGTITLPVAGVSAPAATATDVALWNHNDELARGNLTLHLSPAI